MPGNPRECVEARAKILGGLLVNAFGCRQVLGVGVVGDKALVGRMGSPVSPARLELLGHVLELQETWSYSDSLEKLVRIGYRYAVFPEGNDGEQDEATYRFERHGFGESGRAQTIYGRDGVEHMHVDAGFGLDAHVPTHRISAEDVLRLLADEGPLDDADAALVIEKTNEAERESQDWVRFPVVQIYGSEP